MLCNVVLGSRLSNYWIIHITASSSFKDFCFGKRLTDILKIQHIYKAYAMLQINYNQHYYNNIFRTSLVYLCVWSDILISLSRFRIWSIWVSYGWEDFVFGQSVVLRSSLCLNSFTNRMPSEYGEIPAAKNSNKQQDHFHFSFALPKQEDQARDIWPIAREQILRLLPWTILFDIHNDT